MCKVVLTDHDVNLEKTQPPQGPEDSGFEFQGCSPETQDYKHTQSLSPQLGTLELADAQTQQL